METKSAKIKRIEKEIDLREALANEIQEISQKDGEAGVILRKTLQSNLPLMEKQKKIFEDAQKMGIFLSVKLSKIRITSLNV